MGSEKATSLESQEEFLKQENHVSMVSTVGQADQENQANTNPKKESRVAPLLRAL